MPKENTCLRCGHKWKSKVKKPVSCPRCKSYSWNLKKEG